MIARLRRRHRGLIAVLAVLTPVVFVAAVTARRPPARQDLPEELTSRAAWVRELTAAEGGPDVLVYWSTTAAVTDSLPEDAQLVLEGELPARAEFVHLFSVAHGELIRSLPADEVR